MTQRIRELKKLATTTGYTGLGEIDELDVEKFAELIVKECITTVLKESKWYWDKDEFESSNAIQNAARRLKEYFGVTE